MVGIKSPNMPKMTAYINPYSLVMRIMRKNAGEASTGLWIDPKKYEIPAETARSKRKINIFKRPTGSPNNMSESSAMIATNTLLLFSTIPSTIVSYIFAVST